MIESVSRRIAHVVDSTELDAEELAAAETIEAGAVAADENVTPKLGPVPDEVERQAAALRAAWIEAEQARWRLDVVQAHATDPDPTSLRAAETEAARLPPGRCSRLNRPSRTFPSSERLRRRGPSPNLQSDLPSGTRRSMPCGKRWPSYWGARARLIWRRPGAPRRPNCRRSSRIGRSRPEAEPPAAAPPTDAAEPDAPDSQTESDAPSRRKKGLFRRFGGR